MTRNAFAQEGPDLRYLKQMVNSDGGRVDNRVELGFPDEDWAKVKPF
ncbi:hypothetical protein AB0758_48460 [Tolypothrix bouteillei VB521301_2]